MDERFQDRRIWAIAGVAGVIFLCLMLCGMGALATMFLRSGTGLVTVPQVPAPPAEAGAVPQVYYGPGGGGLFGFLTYGLGMFFKLMFLGLILLLAFGLVKRILWGPRHWGPHRRWAHYYGPHKHRHGPPGGKEWKGRAHPWGPWAAHWCGEPWEEGAEPGSEEDEPGEAEPTYEGTE
ncbi:MAG: hypothetical protein PVF77_04370 [Anaerolineae bacterium]|jgi:hypothetical protein